MADAEPAEHYTVGDAMNAAILGQPIGDPAGEAVMAQREEARLAEIARAAEQRELKSYGSVTAADMKASLKGHSDPWGHVAAQEPGSDALSQLERNLTYGYEPAKPGSVEALKAQLRQQPF